MTSSNFDDCKTGTLELCHVGLGHVAAGVLYCDGERGHVVSDFRVRGPHPRRPLEPSIHVLEQELLELLTKRDQRGVRCCHRYSSDRDDIQNKHWKDEGGSLTGDYPCVSRCTSARVISSCGFTQKFRDFLGSGSGARA